MSCMLKSLIMVYTGSTGCARAWAWCEPFIYTPLRLHITRSCLRESVRVLHWASLVFQVRHFSFFCAMSDHFHKVLVLGHSFVKQLKRHIEVGSNVRTRDHFDLVNSARVFLHGVGGRTVSAPSRHDMAALKRISPDLLVLEVATNDLSAGIRPEVLRPALNDFLSYIRRAFAVRHCSLHGYTLLRTFFWFSRRPFKWESAHFEHISTVVNSHPWAFTWSIGDFRHYLGLAFYLMESTWTKRANFLCTGAITMRSCTVCGFLRSQTNLFGPMSIA